MKCFVIAESEKVRALNVVGVQGIDSESLSDVREAVRKAVSDKTIGTLLVSKRVQADTSDIIQNHRRRGTFTVSSVSHSSGRLFISMFLVPVAVKIRT